ncbi:MAG: archease [Gammaproteobacteria bacterium]|nr:MAG: archease [Gammaproteobacteria bacterium]
MNYAYFDHEADIGITGYGETVEEAFVAAAQAMFAVMADTALVRDAQRIEFSFTESDTELALVTWLNRLLTEAQTQGLALGRFELHKQGEQWQAQAWGEPWREDLERGVEVKGATLTMLSVTRNNGRWEARCVVDV